MKVLNLSKGEAGYVAIPEGTVFTTEETQIRQNGKRLILVRNV